MKRIVSAVLACGILAAVAVPASALAAPPPTTYVACSTDGEAPPSHTCRIGDKPGAFFESSVETGYEVCVTFPDTEELCTEEEEEPPAEADVLYVNELIEADEAGGYLVKWYIEGAEVGSWAFRMEPKVVPPPPVVPPPVVVPPVVVPPAAAPAAVVPPAGPSKACIRAKGKIAALSRKLKGAATPRREAAIRGQLKTARKAKGQAC